MRHIYFGDCLEGLRKTDSGLVTIAYFDPPWNKNKMFNRIVPDSEAQAKGFSDTWKWNHASENALIRINELNPSVGEAIRALMAQSILGHSAATAFSIYMAERLLETKRVLKPEGSIFFHCDPEYSHILRIIMDAAFGRKNFKNEIVWWYISTASPKTRFGGHHDTILFYCMDQEKSIFNTDAMRIPHSPNTKKTRRYGSYTQKTNPLGKIGPDVWEIPIIAATSSERVNWPTQKPMPLLERIIMSASHEGDIVLDPFCGSGTTIEVAESMRRGWIAMDIAAAAITKTKKRLAPDLEINTEGGPTDTEGATQFAQEDRHRFQEWIIESVGGYSHSRGPDSGEDGRYAFRDSENGDLLYIALSVKSGNINPSYIRELFALLDRHDVTMTALLSINEPSANMRAEAASAGVWKSDSWNTEHPRIQLLTVDEILNGKKLNHPGGPGNNALYQKDRTIGKNSSFRQISMLDELEENDE